MYQAAGNENQRPTEQVEKSIEGGDEASPSLWVDFRGHDDIQVLRQSYVVTAAVATPTSETSYFYSP